MNKKIRDILTRTIYLKDIKCLCCGNELNTNTRYCLCDECYRNLPFIKESICQKCGEPIKSLAKYCMRCKNKNDREFDVARAIFYYNGFIAQAIKDYKYSNKRYFAEYLSKFIFDFYVEQGFDCDIVIPAPMSDKSLKTRGFNHVELLCAEFASNGFVVDTDSVKKVLETDNQVNLNFKERQTNLIGAFKAMNKKAIKDKNVLLVDDIYTTGATANEISKVLKKAGAKKVFVITLCHELPQNQNNQQ